MNPSYIMIKTTCGLHMHGSITLVALLQDGAGDFYRLVGQAHWVNECSSVTPLAEVVRSLKTQCILMERVIFPFILFHNLTQLTYIRDNWGLQISPVYFS